MNSTLNFVTSAPTLIEEVSKLLAECKDILKLHIYDCDSPFQESELHQVVTKRVLTYYNQIQSPCISEECVLILDGKTYSTVTFDKYLASFAQHEGKEALVVVVVGYTKDGKEVRTYRGESYGKIVLPRGEQGTAFEKIWQPLGYTKTLSEMCPYKFLVSARSIPYLELANDLRYCEFNGLFEIHVTVHVDSPNSTDHQQLFIKICEKLSVRPVMIELPVGENPTQLMTASYFKGTLFDAHKESFRLSQHFIKEGFKIERTKIEAMCSTSGVPETDEEAAKMSRSNYFEFHIKLKLSSSQFADLTKLNEICNAHNAHLSRNALSVTNKGDQLRFITLRMYFLGKKTALSRYHLCLAALENAGFIITTKQREYSVYDSNVRLDSGWIDHK